MVRAEKQHKTMFLKVGNPTGEIRCVIAAKYTADFERAGFVDHVDKISKRKPRGPNKPKADPEMTEENVDSD